MNTRETSLLDSLQTRLSDSDALTTDGILADIESSAPYLDPGHADHVTFLKMRPMAIAKQMSLAGDNPHASGNDADSSMLDNQVYSHELFETEKPLDFDDEDKAYEAKRANVQRQLEDLQAGKIKNVDEEDLPHFVEATQKQIIQMDIEQDAAIKARETEIARIDDAENTWEQEQTERSQQMKKDFMATRLKGVLKDDKPKITELAEIEWNRLKQDYDF